MGSVFKRDLTGFFYGSSAYFIFAVYALLSVIMAVFWGMYFVSPGRSMLSYFAFQPQILTLLVPAVTMRSWSEERKNGTFENLLTYPVSSWSLVWAKFCAAFAVGAGMLAFSLPLLFTTAYYLSPDYGNIFCCYLGTFGMIAVLTAAGCFFSSLVSLPSVSYLLGLSAGVLWINFNWGGLVSAVWKNAPFYFERALDFSSNYQNFLNGQLNPAAIFYFAGLCALLLFFNWLVIAGRRTE